MKTFALTFILVAFVGCNDGLDTGALSDAFEYFTESVKSTIDSKTYGKYVSKIDFECAKESLNMSSNGQKQVNEVQGIIIAAAAYVKCLKTNEEETLDFATKLVIEEYRIKEGEPTEFDKQINICYKLKLQEIEPSSKLLDNFNASSTEICELVPIDELIEHTIQPVEQQIGPLEIASCGTADKNLVANFLIKFNLIPAEKVADVKMEETQRMVDLFKAKITATADCILNSI